MRSNRAAATTGHPERYALLDSVRGIACAIVVACHVSIVLPGAWNLSNRLGDVSVAVFFVISGFLLYRPFVAARFDRGRDPDRRAYAARRVFRIVPAYWVVLFVTAAAAVAFGIFPWISYSPGHMLRYMFFGQVYDGHTVLAGIPQAWTLCIEMSFYVMLPLWALLIGRFGRSGGERALAAELTGIGLLVAFSILWKAAAASQLPAQSFFRDQPALTTLPAFMDQLALGMALAVLSVGWRRQPPAFVRTLSAQPVVVWGCGLLVCFLLASVVTGGLEAGSIGYVAHTELIAIAALCFVLPAVLGGEGRSGLRRLLAIRPLLYLGLISYGVYLWHETLLAGLLRIGLLNTGFVLLLAMTLAASIAVGSLSWHRLEMPANRFARRLYRRRDRAEEQPARRVPDAPRESGAAVAPPSPRPIPELAAGASPAGDAHGPSR